MISSSERNFIFSAIEKCHCSDAAEDLEEIITYFVGRFIPHKMSICGIGNVETQVCLHRLEFGCPARLMDAMLPVFYMKNNSLLPLWTQKRMPLYSTIADLYETESNQQQRKWLQMLISRGVTNLAMHGVLDMAGGFASFFYLGTLSNPLTAHQGHIFSMLVPHLHHALLNVTHLNTANLMKGEEKVAHPRTSTAEPKSVDDKPDWRLTPRQLEILRWIYRGKTNSETATILGISELTVRNHMQNLMLKLGVANRTQAVVKAMQNNIFSDEGFRNDGMDSPSSHSMEVP